MIKKLYSPEEAAELLGVNPSTIRTWLRDRRLKGNKLAGRIWRITEDALNEFIQDSAVENITDERPIDINFAEPETFKEKGEEG
jgi:excisionase family DNA binding protein